MIIDFSTAVTAEMSFMMSCPLTSLNLLIQMIHSTLLSKARCLSNIILFILWFYRAITASRVHTF